MPQWALRALADAEQFEMELDGFIDLLDSYGVEIDRADLWDVVNELTAETPLDRRAVIKHVSHAIIEGANLLQACAAVRRGYRWG